LNKVVKFLRPDRGPQGCYNTGEIAGFPAAIADKLVAQGYAELADVGNGPGVPILGTPHVREPWEAEDDLAWLKRKDEVEKASTKDAIAKREKLAK
jgi:hypothetical protein